MTDMQDPAMSLPLTPEQALRLIVEACDPDDLQAELIRRHGTHFTAGIFATVARALTQAAVDG